MKAHPHRVQTLLPLLTIAALAGLPLLAGAQTLDTSSLERIAADEMKSTRTPGAALALISDGRVVFEKGFGVASVETGVPVTPDMLFRLGSTTKMLTAAMVVGLAEEGKLKLDAPIGTYATGLPPRLSRATLHHLLSHSSGLRDEATMFGLHDDAALGQDVRALTDDFFFTEPGKIYSYANPGFWVAGFIGEVVSGKPYADAMHDRLFQPLGMTRTTLRPTMAMTYPLAQGHESSGDQAPRVVRPAADNVGNWPAGSVFSSVEDLSRFVMAFMNGGVIDGKPVLPPGVVTRMSAPHVETPGVEPASYGYGLTASTDRGVRMLTHGGSRSGYGSAIAMAPDRHAAVIALANRTGASLPRTRAAAMALLLGRDPKPEAPVPAEVPMTAADMSRVAGRFSQTDRVDVELTVENGKLVIRQGGTSLPVVKLGDRRYGIVRPGAARPQEFFLVPGPDGRAEYFMRGSRALKRMQAPAGG
jgi:CubicO group peptidase (beta-lactamase class C family)